MRCNLIESFSIKRKRLDYEMAAYVFNLLVGKVLAKYEK
ncbi:hypothetical protein PPRY_a2551 [Pseudoalteromonas prydzensis ACAM 620]|nr:hypothetical protein [Pseudoalteromonas prydzensis ACAM 620]